MKVTDDKIFNLVDDTLVNMCYISTHRTTVLNWMKVPGIREAATKDLLTSGCQHTLSELRKYLLG